MPNEQSLQMPPKKSGLKWRLITGFSFAALVLCILFALSAWTHMVLLLVIFLLAQLEYAEMVSATRRNYDFKLTTVCGILLLLTTALESPVGRSMWERHLSDFVRLPNPGHLDFSSWIMVLTPALLLTAGVLRRKTEGAMERFALSYAGFWYIAVLLSFLVRLVFEWEIRPDFKTNYTGRFMILWFALIVKFADVGGYAFGSLFGKHKLIPEISPKKTVEGLIGSYVVSTLVSICYWAIFATRYAACVGSEKVLFIHAITLPLLLVTTGIAGDLAESLIKRSVGVKDSSSRFPGMGGILDILDSILFSAPFMYAYVIWIIKASNY